MTAFLFYEVAIIRSTRRNYNKTGIFDFVTVQLTKPTTLLLQVMNCRRRENQYSSTSKSDDYDTNFHSRADPYSARVCVCVCVCVFC